ncbi:MAG TPA: class I SAM-dependent methyltransferase family protein, partial [Chthoniobacter sp.]|nr:class I SAM-dependent methyltransferase family protein [Chthoniobacter sp.]
MNTAVITPANFTRKTVDLPAKFRREGRFALIPLYHFLRLSDLAREGIEHSGSYRFADHIYRDEPSGAGWLGRWLDRRLLNLAASRAMRGRYLHACEEMHRACQRFFADERTTPFRLLTVPCGIPRDVFDFAERLKAEHPERLRRVEYSGMDLDPTVCAAAGNFLAGSALRGARIFPGNA